MVRLTNERDLIQSLIQRSLGKGFMKFTVNTSKEGNLILEFETENRKFTLSKVDGFQDDIYALRVYDDGRAYMIPPFNRIDAMKSNLLRIIDSYSSVLYDFYTTKIDENAKETTVVWIKRD